ncbi:MFS transporter [Streptomyces sp. 4N509B]|uniref:MFS transporter n=1 Tax=Streptomyces sp. 4N509B TaxID=3457413 RepID=UPI003FD11FFA
MSPSPHGAPPPGHAGSPATAGVRLGLLGGPAVFGVTAAGLALPDVGRALDAAPSATAWVLTVHALALGVGAAVAGRLADARGVRFALLLGAFALGLGTLVCLLAPNLPLLVAGRLALATGSGATTSGAVALVAAFPPERRPRVLAGFGGTMAGFSAAATLAGGVVTDGLGWRVTLVLPGLALGALALCLPMAGRAGSGRPVDAAGAGLVAACASCLLVVVQSPTLGLPAAATVPLAVLAASALAALVARVRRRADGFVPRPLVTDPVVLRTVGLGVGVFGALFATVFAAPQILVLRYGWDVLVVGAALLPGGVVGAVLARRASAATVRVGTLLLAVTSLATAGCLALTAVVDGSAVVVVTASAALCAFAVTQVVVTARIAQRVGPAARGGATGLLNQACFVGGAMAAAAVGTLSRSVDPRTALAAVAVLPLAAGVLALTDRPATDRVPTDRGATDRGATGHGGGSARLRG